MENEAARTNVGQRKYVYALIPGGHGRVYGDIGIDKATVETISVPTATAVVSDVSRSTIRPERRHFAAHRAVLKSLDEEAALLPMSFGVICDNSEAVHAFLSANGDAIAQELARLAGKVEMGLRVKWAVPNIFEYMVDTHPELRAARDRVFGADGPVGPELKIELGRMFENVLEADRNLHCEEVEAVLKPHCYEIKRNDCREELEVMNLACLIDKNGQQEFEQGIFQAARSFDDNFAFDFSGPWSPHNFVELQVEL